MGEVVVVSSDDGMEMTRNKGLASEIVRWEKYMPKTVLRVLLVESDDSTRQIITALLRKCCYKVTGVSDGLAAWEILKGKTHNIDLILTELDLPSISGFALLSLVMEHEACKNIPVIMMSSQDSITMVLKCMLKGAADYLIKPVRKNELKNLWQHVWRRLSLGNNPAPIHSLPASQHNIEDSDEFSADSRYHSDQGSGAQGISRGNDYIVYSSQDKLIADSTLQEKKVESFDVTMDLIGGIDKRPECFYGDRTHDKDTDPELGLSLKRSCSGISENQDESKHQKLSLSDASALLRYENDTTGQKTGEASSSAGPKTPTESHEKLRKVGSDHGSVTTSSNQENIGSSVSGTLHQTQQLQEQTYQSTLNYNTNEGIARQSSSTEKLKQEEGFNVLTQEGLRGTLDPQRTSQREAALMKFRLKRKDRCFDKKVRYQSRKKLAEQRPRVKGQFVRAVNSDASNKA